MEILKKLDHYKFINWLKEDEEKTKFIIYLMDNAYDFEEDNTLDSKKNDEIIKFISKYKKYAYFGELTSSDSSERKNIENRDLFVENKIEEFKKLRQRKLERLLNDR